MKKIIIAGFVILPFFASDSIAQSLKKGPRPTQNFDALPEEAYNKNKLLIKLTPAAHEKMKAAYGKKKYFGIPELDAICTEAKVVRLRQFSDTKSMKQEFKQRHEAWGFHLWYILETADTSNTKQYVAQLSKLQKWIAVAEPELKITQDSWTPNDPRYVDQWHYNNIGALSGTIDADIDLPEAWELETGKPNILVAVVDGGIDTNHVDLKQNLWTSATERFGYNFIDDTEGVYGHSHGTHVAGTVGAISNNGIGVSGVAGGNGSETTGIRMMSSQVFGTATASSPGFVNAIIYGADRGAAISQNSWGHTAPLFYNSAYLDAIDYFIAYGGGDLYDEGLVIFSAGNDNHELPKYPGHYERVIRVAATNNKDIRAYYSCFGVSVDIAAPGGETNVLAARGVLSTNIGNAYIYNNGTSMASPHVSGVAALVASRAQDRLSIDDIRSVIVNEVDNIDAVNTPYIGKLGKGRLNAFKALQKTDSIIAQPAVAAPANFIATQTSCGNFNLSWTKNSDEDEVIVAVATVRKGLFGIPKGSYSVGDTIAGGGVIIYKGTANSSTYFFGDTNNRFIGFKAWSVSDAGHYSKGIFDFSNYTPCLAVAGNKYVKQGATGSGASWADASGDLQAMINSSLEGDTIMVATGTYKPIRKQYDVYTISTNNRFNSFVLKKGITLLGGFPADNNAAGVSDRNYNTFETILSGDLGVDGVSSDNSYNVVYSDDATDNTTLFDGFTITGGNANATTNNGGGGWRNYGSCRASNLKFTGNRGIYGAGMECGGNATLRNIEFTNNFSTGSGGGFYSYADSVTISNASFNNNTAVYGAAFIAQGGMRLDSAIIEDNNASTSGGAGYFQTGTVRISNSTVKRNEASYGGAFYNDGGNAILLNVILDSNTATTSGGAWYNSKGDPSVTNTRITNGSANYGGAWHNVNGNPNLKNVTISNNYTSSSSSGNISYTAGNLKITNSIIWGNTASNDAYDDTYNVGDASMINTIKGNNIWYGLDSIISIGTTAVLNMEDYTLLSCSPAINRGINDSVVAVEDLAGNIRIINSQVDLGAYEQNSLELNEIADSILIADDDCSTDNWLHFLNSATDKIIVSINTNGQDLGTVTAKGVLNDKYGTGSVHVFEGAFGSSDYFYPFNRSWVISSTNAPTTPVNVRFYFSTADSADIAANIEFDSIADLLLYKVDGENAWDTAATGYIGYTNGLTPSTTQYQLGTYQGLMYAEFQVNSFSAGSMAFKSPVFTPLPVDLLNFAGSNVNNQKTLLTWETTREENLDKFDIEKSKDGISWQYSSSVKAVAKGNYQSWDNQPFDGLNLYRLKMVDNDGSYQYSPIVKVMFERAQAASLNVYPNPNKGKFVLVLSNSPEKPANLRLTDITGRVLHQSSITAAETELDIQDITAGIYTLQILVDGTAIYQKIVVQ